MLVNSKALLLHAKEHGYAIPATNFIDLDSARTFVAVAEDRNLPLILPFAQSHRHILSLEEAAAIGRLMAESVSVPVVLHLDHGEDFDYIKRAIDLGFSSVMIDASQASFDKNVTITQQVTDYAHQYDITVEAELGHVGANDTLEAGDLTDAIYTVVEDVMAFVAETQVDSLAVSIGTAHGIYKGEPKLSFERLEEIRRQTTVPLVLHGGSSTGDENLHRCATGGIAKINIYSDFIKAAYEAILAGQSPNYIAMKAAANSAMAQVLSHYYEVFNTQSYTQGGFQ